MESKKLTFRHYLMIGSLTYLHKFRGDKQWRRFLQTKIKLFR